jgi:hypothetical protein
MNGDSPTAPEHLVRCLRLGVREELIAILKIQLDPTLDHHSYGDAFARLDEGRNLLDVIGFAEVPAIRTDVRASWQHCQSSQVSCGRRRTRPAGTHESARC